MSLQRAFIVLYKDLVWAKQNTKLLALMIMPVFIMLFFSKLDSEGTFGFSLSFINAFVGIFSTSYLVTEEKNRGTLVSLLTTPLRGEELLLGKFLFNLILCLSFTLLSMVLNQRLDLFLRPIALLNCFLFAGTTCFFGYTLGVFFKNEKEMSVLAPFLLIYFVMGDSLENLSTKVPIGGFFPSYHLIKVVGESPLTLSMLWIHTAFSLALFSITLFMAKNYTNFYFSNHRDNRRISLGFILSALSFVGVMALSGFYVIRSHKGERVDKDGYKILNFETAWWDVEFRYDEKRFNLKEIMNKGNRKAYYLENDKSRNTKIILSVRKLEENESTFDKRGEGFRTNYKRQVLAEELSPILGGYPSRNWVYLYKDDFTVLREVICEDEVFQWGVDQKVKNMTSYKTHFKDFSRLGKKLKIRCKGEVQGNL